jgi:ParB family transcriptional regulator, chromosome partitioning protein
MAELRNVCPLLLKPNPHNPRITPPPAAMDEQLLASIKAIGIIQPPVVVEKDGELVIKAGTRRVCAAIAAGLATIEVIVADGDEANGAMESLSENLIRASMNSVDIWRGIDALEQRGWNEPAIADALALPVRTIRRLKLLAHLHPPMLHAIAKGSMPSEDQLRTIAAATREEQAQVWKKYRPKKDHDVYWSDVARALAKRRIPFSAAKFGDDLAQAYGVVWEDDLFAPADEDGRYTTNVDGFFGAQQEWLQNNLPERGTLLPQDEYGRPQLPKKAENVYGTPGKNDRIGHYLDPYSGAVKTVVYRLPETRKSSKADKDPVDTAPDPAAPQPKTRPDVTQRGLAMIGDFRTDALHQASREARIEDSTLLGLLVLALAAKNVSVQSGADIGPFDREAIAATINEGGVLTSDLELIRTAARNMLVAALSCRDNMSNSGLGARIAGEAVGASLYLPTMATDEFLTCLSRQALEKVAETGGVRAEVRVRDTRARIIERFSGTRYVYPGALFQLTAEEIAAAAAPPNHLVHWPAATATDSLGGDAGSDEEIMSDTGALPAPAIADPSPAA